MYNFKMTLFIFKILFTVCQAIANDKYTQQLFEAKKIQASVDECQTVENHLGQLLYVNVDGFNGQGAAISPEYVKMVRELNIGGVLPHFKTYDPDLQKKATADLQEETELPLMIGVDYNNLSDPDWANTPIAGGITYGQGYGFGMLGLVGGGGQSCVEQMGYLDAFLHRAVGLNQALGPTVERNTRNAVLNQEA